MLLTCALGGCGDEPFAVPPDEIGVALMQQHLRSEHDIALVGVWHTCAECGTTVLCNALTEDAPQTCQEHS